ncbi:hypothetical protein OIU77_023503, partial [Salix suchowensis]
MKPQMFDLYHEHRQTDCNAQKTHEKYAPFLRNHRRPLDHQSFVLTQKRRKTTPSTIATGAHFRIKA